MKTSELIAELQEILEREGDQDVSIEVGREEAEAEDVVFQEGDSGWDYWHPSRVVIR
jgi:hypothetical protein